MPTALVAQNSSSSWQCSFVERKTSRPAVVGQVERTAAAVLKLGDMCVRFRHETRTAQEVLLVRRRFTNLAAQLRRRQGQEVRLDSERLQRVLDCAGYGGRSAQPTTLATAFDPVFGKE